MRTSNVFKSLSWHRGTNLSMYFFLSMITVWNSIGMAFNQMSSCSMVICYYSIALMPAEGYGMLNMVIEFTLHNPWRSQLSFLECHWTTIIQAIQVVKPTITCQLILFEFELRNFESLQFCVIVQRKWVVYNSLCCFDHQVEFNSDSLA